MKLSICTTLYCSAKYVTDFYARCTAVATKLVGDSYEIIFVNDGSPDDSLDIAIALSNSDPHVVVVDLTRNFGHHKALMVACSFAKGEQIFLIDSDLEESPEWLLDFAQEMTDHDCDVVYGVQNCRKGSKFERISGSLFYKIFNFVSGVNLTANMVTARLMTRRYVLSLLQHKEQELFLAGIWLITGYQQRPFPVEKKSTSPTTYSFTKKIQLALNAITSFTSSPLVWIFYTGILVSVVSILFVAYLCTRWWFFSIPPVGWTSLIISVWLVGGLMFLFIGVVGIYLSKIFIEVKQRPYALIRSVHKKN